MAELLSPKSMRADDQGSAIIEVSGHGIGGFKWSADVIEGEGDIISAVPSADLGNIGSGAVLRFTVSGVGKSGCTVALKYQRPWEPESLIQHTVTIHSNR